MAAQLEIENPNCPERPYVHDWSNFSAWRKNYSDAAGKFLEKRLAELQQQFRVHKLDAYFWINDPKEPPRKTWIGLGLARRAKGKQCALHAFGFYYEDCYNWTPEYIMEFIERAAQLARGFLIDEDYDEALTNKLHIELQEEFPLDDMPVPPAGRWAKGSEPNIFRLYEYCTGKTHPNHAPPKPAPVIKPTIDFDALEEDEVDPLS